MWPLLWFLSEKPVE